MDFKQKHCFAFFSSPPLFSFFSFFFFFFFFLLFFLLWLHWPCGMGMLFFCMDCKIKTRGLINTFHFMKPVEENMPFCEKKTTTMSGNALYWSPGIYALFGSLLRCMKSQDWSMQFNRRSWLLCASVKLCHTQICGKRGDLHQDYSTTHSPGHQHWESMQHQCRADLVKPATALLHWWQ